MNSKGGVPMNTLSDSSVERAFEAYWGELIDNNVFEDCTKEELFVHHTMMKGTWTECAEFMNMIKGRCKDCAICDIEYLICRIDPQVPTCKKADDYCSHFTPRAVEPKVTVEGTHDEPSGSFVKSCDNCRYKKDVKPFDVGVCEFCKRCYVNADNSFRDCWQPKVEKSCKNCRNYLTIGTTTDYNTTCHCKLHKNEHKLVKKCWQPVKLISEAEYQQLQARVEELEHRQCIIYKTEDDVECQTAKENEALKVELKEMTKLADYWQKEHGKLEIKDTELLQQELHTSRDIASANDKLLKEAVEIISKLHSCFDYSLCNSCVGRDECNCKQEQAEKFIAKVDERGKEE